MEDQFANLKSLGFELASNVRVPVAAELMSREVEELEERWGVMREAILGTLERIKREMEKWVEGKVTSVKKLIEEEDEVLSRMMVFVEEFPFQSLLQVDLTELSGEVEELVKYEVGGVWREWWHQVWGGNGGIRCGEGMVASGVGRGNGGIRCGEGMVASGVEREWWHQVWGGNGGIRCGEGMVASGVEREWWHQVWRGNGGIRCGEGMVASGVEREWWHQVWRGNGGIRCGEGMVASGVGRGNGGIRCGEGMVASGVEREW